MLEVLFTLNQCCFPFFKINSSPRRVPERSECWRVVNREGTLRLATQRDDQM
jgi:hypothetical protein